MDQQPIGLIGLGLLGSAMAERFLANGHLVLGFDLDPTRVAIASQHGVTIAANVAQVAEATTTLVLSLPHSEISRQVCEEVESALQPDSLIIDTTTGRPAEMIALGDRLAAQGHRYLDACVGGSSEQARQGRAIVMVGGDPRAIEQATPIFNCFAKQVFHVGPAGRGARMKLVMNLVLGLNRAVLAEGLSFADRLGLDLNLTLEILKASPACSTVMDTKGEKMLQADFTPQAKLAQHWKDVTLMQEAAKETQATIPLTHLHEELLRALIESGYGDDDNSAIIKAFQ